MYNKHEVVARLCYIFFLLSTSYVHKVGIINFGYHLRKRRLTESSKFSQVLILMTAE